MNLRRIAFLAALAGCPGLLQAEQNASDLTLLKGRLEKQLAEISALDGEIQNLSQRLGREGTPLPRREPERPAPPPEPVLETPPPAVPPAQPETLAPPEPQIPSPEPNTPPPAPVETTPPAVAPAPAEPTPPVPVAVAVAVPEPAPAPPMVPEAPAPIAPTPVEPAIPEPTAPPEVAEPEPPAPAPVAPEPIVEEPSTPAPASSGGSYTVVAGDTLSAIARKHKVSLAALQKANPGITPEKLRLGQKLAIPGSGMAGGPDTPSAPEAPAPTPAPAALVYEVQPGDTLHGIARRSGTTVEALSKLNGITSPQSLKVGAKLKLPDGATKPAAVANEAPAHPRPPTPGTHIVKPGDTLSSISRETGTPIDELRRVNNLKDDTIHPGQSLKVRRGGPAAKPATGGNTGASAPAAKPAAKPSVKPAPAQGVEMAEYTVREGESLFSIARRYFLSREELAAMNALPVDVPLQAGQKLRLPAVAISATRMAESESHAH